MSDLQKFIRDTFDEVSEYHYSDGCILFNVDLCTSDEAKRLNDSGMLDTLSRILAEKLEARFQIGRLDYAS